MRIECPHCLTSYPVERTCVKVEVGVHFTIVCSVCNNDFDGVVSEQVAVPDVVTVIAAKPAAYEQMGPVAASRLHTWTLGLLGTPEVPGYRRMVESAVGEKRSIKQGSPATLTISTRKRSEQ